MIYFIQCAAFVKIGYCERDPIRRLEKLQIGCPLELRLLALLVGDRADEAAWHSQYAKARVRGEWFRLGKKMIQMLKPHMVDHDEVSRNRPDRKIEGFPAHLLEAAIGIVAEREPMDRLSNQARQGRCAL